MTHQGSLGAGVNTPLRPHFSVNCLGDVGVQLQATVVNLRYALTVARINSPLVTGILLRGALVSEEHQREIPHQLAQGVGLRTDNLKHLTLLLR